MTRFRRRVLAAALLFAAAGASAHTNERGIDPQNFDESVGACADFFQYANGGWLRKHPIPASEASRLWFRRPSGSTAIPTNPSTR